jgi:hypothetical protein
MGEYRGRQVYKGRQEYIEKVGILAEGMSIREAKLQKEGGNTEGRRENRGTARIKRENENKVEGRYTREG